MIRQYVLDTNIVSYVLKFGSGAAEARILSLSASESACISAITEAELLYGIAKAGAGQKRQSQLSLLLRAVQVLSWDREAAAAYARLRVQQEAMGRTLGPLDMQIAAHALSLKATLVTADRAFRHVPDLPIENWATDLHQ